MPLERLDPEGIHEFLSSGKGGEISYKLCKMFLETDMPLAKVPNDELEGRPAAKVSSSLNAYIRRHELPMKNALRGEIIYFYRTDIAEDGTVQPLNIDDFVQRLDFLPPGVASQALRDRTDIPTLGASTARERLASENEPPE